MQITIVCDSLQEVKDLVDRMFVMLPEEGTPERKQHEKSTAQLVDEAIAQDAQTKKKRRARVNRETILQLHREELSAVQIAAKTGYGYSTICKVIQEAREQ